MSVQRPRIAHVDSTQLCSYHESIMEAEMIATNAIIMAVGKTQDESLSQFAPNGCKSLIDINGRPALSYVLENLRNCNLISKVILVSDKITRDLVPDADIFIEAHDYSSDSIMASIREIDDSKRCLMMGGDMPVSSCEAINDLLSCAPDCDVVYPVVEKADVKDAFPNREAYYVQAKEGKFTGSSCLLFKPEIAFSKEELLVNLLNARKNPKALLGLVGPGVALKLMFGSPSLLDLEKWISDALQIDCKVFHSHFPELVMSIDCAKDIALMEEDLRG